MTYEQITKFLSYADPAPYSGRGMYGYRCPCVRGATLQHVLADIVEQVNDRAAAVTLVRWAQWDRLGDGVVVYWPSATLEAA